VPKLRKNRIREERIHNEAIVDAYGPEEQALGWYYYRENKIQFPFTARCIASKVISPLRKGETVEVRGLAPEDSCAHDMLVLIRWHDRNAVAGHRLGAWVLPLTVGRSSAASPTTLCAFAHGSRTIVC
jgi:Calcium binding